MKQVTHLRVGNTICPVDGQGCRTGELERLPSISAAKRRSRELQANGAIVRLAKTVPQPPGGRARW